MIIDRNLRPYIIFTEDSILNALKKIEENQGRIIFCVSENGQLEGLLTNGDIIRWLTQQKENADLSQAVSEIANQSYLYAFQNDPPQKIESYLEKVLYVPIIDQHGHLTAVARRRKSNEGINISNFLISETSPTFVVAEIGINHNGSLELAKQLVDEAVTAGANCAKFQMRDMTSLYQNAGEANDAKENLGTQYTLDLLSRFQLTTDEMFQIFDYCQEQGILPLCTPWDKGSLEALETYGMPAYKVASADLTNHEFLTALAKTNKPLICSTGMSTEQEIQESVQLLRHLGVQYILLQCNSTYPAPFKDINLKYMDRLKTIGECPVGYSGHERGTNVVIAAVARGAKVIEKHFTLDRAMEGNDHKVSLLPHEFQTMIEGIRQVEESLGTDSDRRVTQGEMMNRVNLAKSLVVNCDLAIGDTITAEMIEVKSPGRGLQPNRREDLIGKTAKRPLQAGDFFYPSDLEEEKVQSRNYHFQRAWGLPVRYHDFEKILSKTNPDFLEFHLSYKDMEESIEDYLKGEYNLDLVVHSPELFAGDHTLDLCSQDEEYRQYSIQELQRVINITRTLKPYFKKATRPCIVTNIGGFTFDFHLHHSERQKLYELLLKSLSQLDTAGVEIIPQTMPPFPWHFGGQRYHNLFVDAQEIAEFCANHQYRICLDISHSKLACNHYKWSFQEFVETVGAYTAHLHIADSEGKDGEGLQIGEGEIDFHHLSQTLAKVAQNALFIPEIWQGHENEGEGFWIALERLEGLF
ncbi:N-acetylneuraminate synthase family protein [Dactylococcopsis salina]|uniref:Sialic acid synthase n=1 Tax=Dactylococcopsis salina (strain PCC 8305) TaxID=13035 RepID=K9YSH0_DACS8|nr:N-acetylneuraminate synthase family protein [Dactylococcopsis salina]AFZ49063.1 sialic acid synthase [Dactylococcopsis salina PCC 8305]